MECLEAQAILSAAHDGEPVDPADLQAASEHCSECDDCATFAAGLRYLDVMPAPHAPAATIDATLAAVSEAATERAEAARFEALHAAAVAEATAASATEPEVAAAPEPIARRRFPWLNDSAKWAGIGAIGAAAAIALVAFVLIGNGLGSKSGIETARTSSTTSSAAPDLTFSGSGAQAPGAGTTSTPTNPTPSTAPDYVSYNGLVYTPGSLLADSSTATPTIGAVTTAFASAGAPQRVTVYGSPLTDGSIVIQGPDGYRLYTPVIRMYQSRRYQLAAGNALDRFGQWPTLPSRFPAPASPGGSPTFSPAGIDALGVNIFSAVGQPVASGFAVAPGTSAVDPAAGNPDWTWWQPVQ
jgi:hypothetical protein